MNLLPARRVLVPVDLTPASAWAWSWAKAISAPGAELEAFRALPDLPLPLAGGLPAPAYPRATLRRAEKALLERFPGAAVKVEEGDPAALIARRARRAQLVVLASHHRAGLDRALLGSVSEAVVRASPSPALVVRAAPKRVRSVLAPMNYMPYARRGLELAAEAARFFGAELVLLNVTPDEARRPNPRFALGSALAALPDALARGLKTRLLQKTGDPVRVILEESRRHGLVALTAHRKSLLTDWVLGTTAERVIRHSPTPVLTAPSK